MCIEHAARGPSVHHEHWLPSLLHTCSAQWIILFRQYSDESGPTVCKYQICEYVAGAAHMHNLNAHWSHISDGQMQMGLQLWDLTHNADSALSCAFSNLGMLTEIDLCNGVYTCTNHM